MSKPLWTICFLKAAQGTAKIPGKKKEWLDEKKQLFDFYLPYLLDNISWIDVGSILVHVLYSFPKQNLSIYHDAWESWTFMNIFSFKG